MNLYAPLWLEAMREAGDDGVVSEEGVAVGDVVLDFGDAGRAVAVKRPGTVDRERGALDVDHEAGVEREDEAGAAKAVGVAEEVADGDAFAADAERESDAAEVPPGDG